MVDTWITPTRKKELTSYIDQLKKMSGAPVEEEDLYAAGFSERDLEDIGWFTPAPKASMMAGDGSKLEAYTPTSRDNVRNNVRGGLEGLGVDKSVASDISRTVAGNTGEMGLADFTPMGALFGAEEGAAAAKRGYETGDYVGAGLGAAEAALSVVSAIPGTGAVSKGVEKLSEKLAGYYDPSVVRTLFSPTSVKADLGKLKTAETMAAEGASEAEIWAEAGWWKGPNGWRFEVDDSQTKLPETPMGTTWRGENSALYNNPEYWDALVPRDGLTDEYKKVYAGEGTLENTSLGGHFDSYEGKINTQGQTPEEQKMVATHELQHAVQYIFGDAGRGINPKYTDHQFKMMFDNLPAELKPAVRLSTEHGYTKARYEDLQKRAAILEEEIAVEDADLGAYIQEHGRVPESWGLVGESGTKQKKLNLITNELSVLEDSLRRSEKALGTFAENNSDFAQAMEEFKILGKGLGEESLADFDIDEVLEQRYIFQGAGLKPWANHKLYEMEGGEVEARIVGSRAGLSAEERAKSHPGEWIDIRNKDNIYNFGQFNDWLRGVGSDADVVRKKQGYAEGGVVQEKDPVSGNTVPPGAEPKEVRDDIDAKLSDGEYVIPADVVRYIGLDKIEKLVLQAKEGLSEMNKNGRIGGEDVPITDELPFTDEELMGTEEPIMMAAGGLVSNPLQNNPVANPAMNPLQNKLGVAAEIMPTPGVSTEQKAVTNPDELLPKWMNDSTLGVGTGGLTPTKSVGSDGDPTKGNPTGMAGAVEGWKAKDFSSAVKQRMGDPATSFLEGMVGRIPFGKTMMKARHAYLDKKVPTAIDNMIKAGVDVDGTPLTKEQIADLQQAKKDFEATKGYKPQGFLGLAKKAVKDVVGTPKKKEEEAKKAETNSSQKSDKPSSSDRDKSQSSSGKSSSSSKSDKDGKGDKK